MTYQLGLCNYTCGKDILIIALSNMRKIFQEKQINMEYLQKKAHIFGGFPVEDIKISDIILLGTS